MRVMMKTIQTVPFHTIPKTFAPDESGSAPIAIPLHRIVGHEIRHYLNILTEGFARLRSQVSIEAQDGVVSGAGPGLTKVLPAI